MLLLAPVVHKKVTIYDLLFMNNTIYRSNYDLFMNDTISRSNYDLFMKDMFTMFLIDTI